MTARKRQVCVRSWTARTRPGSSAAGRWSEAIAWAHKAAAEAAAVGAKESEARAYNVLDLAGVGKGDYSGGEYWLRALGIFEDLGDLVGQSTALSNLGMGSLYEGRWSEALDYVQRCAEVSARAGDVVGETLAADNGAQFLSDHGCYREDAESVLRASARGWKAIGHREFLGLCLNLLGRNCGRTGRFDEALALLSEARGELDFAGAAAEVLDTDAKIAECHALRGSSALALEPADEALAGAGSRRGRCLGPLLMLVRGYALAQLDRLDEGKKALEEHLRLAREREGGAHFEMAMAIIALARLGRLMGDPISPELEREGAELIERLGVVCRARRPLAGDVAHGKRKGPPKGPLSYVRSPEAVRLLPTAVVGVVAVKMFRAVSTRLRCSAGASGEEAHLLRPIRGT